MNDLIYRQQAIATADSTDYLGLAIEDVKKVTDEVVKGLKQLPSAHLPDMNVGDMISRRQAVYVASGYCHPANIADELRKLPSAQPERKKGKWIEKEDPYGFFNSIPVCSECGCTTKMRERYNFCPNCGADLRGEQDDSV